MHIHRMTYSKKPFQTLTMAGRFSWYTHLLSDSPVFALCYETLGYFSAKNKINSLHFTIRFRWPLREIRRVFRIKGERISVRNLV
jgi:hypothetical protein